MMLRLLLFIFLLLNLSACGPRANIPVGDPVQQHTALQEQAGILQRGDVEVAIQVRPDQGEVLSLRFQIASEHDGRRFIHAYKLGVPIFNASFEADGSTHFETLRPRHRAVRASSAELQAAGESDAVLGALLGSLNLILDEIHYGAPGRATAVAAGPQAQQLRCVVTDTWHILLQLNADGSKIIGKTWLLIQEDGSEQAIAHITYRTLLHRRSGHARAKAIIINDPQERWRIACKILKFAERKDTIPVFSLPADLPVLNLDAFLAELQEIDDGEG